MASVISLENWLAPAGQRRAAAWRPSVLRLSRPQARPSAPGSDVLDVDDFVALRTARRVHVGRVAGLLADQRARDRRADRDQALLDVGLVVADDLVGDFLAGRLFFQHDRGAEDDAPP